MQPLKVLLQCRLLFLLVPAALAELQEFPSFRIDYVLHSPTLYTVGYIREDITLSDHYPIKVKIRKGS